MFKYSNRKKFVSERAFRSFAKKLNLPLEGKSISRYSSVELENLRKSWSHIIGIDYSDMTNGNMKVRQNITFECVSMDDFENKFSKLKRSTTAIFHNFFIYKLA